MDLCNVNVDKLKAFKFGREITIEFLGEESYLQNLTRHFLVNGKHATRIDYDSSFQVCGVEEDIDFLKRVISEAVSRKELWTKKL